MQAQQGELRVKSEALVMIIQVCHSNQSVLIPSELLHSWQKPAESSLLATVRGVIQSKSTVFDTYEKFC